MNEVRIDKWLWATRLFKTRSLAAQACKKGRVLVRDLPVKPAAMIRVGEVIQLRKPSITLHVEVLALTQNRMGAKLVPQYLRDVTPAQEYERLELQKLSGYVARAKGLGRPTKKERRDLDEFFTPDDFLDFWSEDESDEDEALEDNY